MTSTKQNPSLRALQLELQKLEMDQSNNNANKNSFIHQQLDDNEDVVYRNNKNSFVPASMLSPNSKKSGGPVSSSSLNNVGVPNSSPPLISSSSTSNVKSQQQQFEEAMKMQAIANLRRVKLSNDFIEYNQNNNNNNYSSNQRSTPPRNFFSHNKSNFTNNEIEENSSFASSSALPAGKNNNNTNNNNEKSLQRKRFEQAPSEIYHHSESNNRHTNNKKQHVMLHGILGIDDESPIDDDTVNNFNQKKSLPPAHLNSPASSSISGQSSRFNNYNGKNRDNLQLQNAFMSPSASMRKNNFNHEEASPPSSSASILHNNNQNNNNFGSLLIGAATNPTGSNSSTAALSHHGKAQAKRLQIWNKETNILQAALSEIETTNATMTLREYRKRTKPRTVISLANTNNSNNDINTKVSTATYSFSSNQRPASAPFVSNFNKNNNQHEDDDHVSSANNSKTPSSKAKSSSLYHRQDDENNNNRPHNFDDTLMMGVADDPELREALALRGVLEETPEYEIFRGPHLSRYNDPVLETKANKRLSELMAREAEERSENALRSLGAAKLEELVMIDDETIAQQRRARAVTNAAKRRMVTLYAHTNNNDGDGDGESIVNATNSSAVASSSTLVPPRTIYSSAQENIRSDFRRELALKEQISLSDLAIHIADDAFEREHKLRRAQEEATHANQLERLTMMKKISSNASAAEAVLLVKHQARLESTRQTIRAELDRCKILTDELKAQSERAVEARKKLQKMLGETVQRIGRGFFIRKNFFEVVKALNQEHDSQRERLLHEYSPHRRQQQQLNAAVSGDVENEEEKVDDNNEKLYVLNGSNQQQATSSHSSLRTVLEETKREFYVVGDGVAISPNFHNNNASPNNKNVEKNLQQSPPPSPDLNPAAHAAVSSLRASTPDSSSQRQRHANAYQNYNSSLTNNNNNLSDPPPQPPALLLRQDTLAFPRRVESAEDDNNFLFLGQQQRQHVQQIRHKTAQEEWSELLTQRENLQKLVLSDASTAGNQDNNSSRLNENHYSNKNTHNPLLQSSMSSSNSNFLSSLTGAKNHLPEQQEKQNLEALVTTQERIIQLLSERQAAGVKTLKMLQDGKIKTRQSNRAAAVIQSLVRMFLARCRFLRMLADKDFEELSHEAALMIQRVWRGSQARTVAKRRHQLRQKYAAVPSSSLSSNNKNKNTTFNTTTITTSFKNAAACAIQSIWFCFVARQFLHRLRADRAEADSSRLIHDAAHVVTNFVRNVVLKRKIEQDKVDRILRAMSQKQQLQMQQLDLEQQFATSLIVRIWRVHVEMKKYQREKSTRLLRQQTTALSSLRKRSSSVHVGNVNNNNNNNNSSINENNNNLENNNRFRTGSLLASHTGSFSPSPFSRSLNGTGIHHGSADNAFAFFQQNLGFFRFNQQQQQQFAHQISSANEEDVQEMEFAVRRIQNSWIANTTRRLFHLILKAKGTKMNWAGSEGLDSSNNNARIGDESSAAIVIDLPVNFINSVPRRNMETISRILDQRQKQIAKEMERGTMKKNDHRGEDQEEPGGGDDDEEERIASRFVADVVQSAVELDGQLEEEEEKQFDDVSPDEIPNIQIIEASSNHDETNDEISTCIVKNIMFAVLSEQDEDEEHEDDIDEL